MHAYIRSGRIGSVNGGGDVRCRDQQGPGIQRRFIRRQVVLAAGWSEVEIEMKWNAMFAATAVAAMLVAMSLTPTRAQAQGNVEAEILGFHQLCDKGDRRACVRFGILIGQNQQRHADWRRAHADWWWWEK
jgi:methyl coenzyme M reductase beta subunit